MLRFKAVDLFSGCGGLTQGLRSAKFDVIGAVEINDLAVETYKMNHRSVNVWHADIRDVDPHAFMFQLGLGPGDLDLLAGCPPCQGFSSMRTLNGARVVDDPRNDLVHDFLRFIRALRPKTVMLENVPGLDRDQRFMLFRASLEGFGYEVRCHIVDASDYGVPQRRRRLLLLASKYGAIPLSERQCRRRSVRSAIGSLPVPGSSGDALHDFAPAKHSSKVMEMIESIPHDGGSRADLAPEYQLECHKRSDGFSDVYGRMAWNDVSPTITSGCWNPSKGRFLHPEQNRAISLREAALLQSFPRRYKFSVRRGKSQTAEMIGNALPPQLIRCHADQIREHLMEALFSHP